MIDVGINPAFVAEAAGNSEEIIFKHYYKTTKREEILKKINKAI